MSLSPHLRRGGEALSHQVKAGVTPIPKLPRAPRGRGVYTYAFGQHADCWLARFTDTPCEGRLVRVHLIEKAVLKRAGLDPWDERAWVWACGGLGHGNEAHHGDFDSLKLRVPRSALPKCVEELAVEIGAEGRLYRRYGPTVATAMRSITGGAG
jgi:hypothetical protein